MRLPSLEPSQPGLQEELSFFFLADEPVVTVKENIDSLPTKERFEAKLMLILQTYSAEDLHKKLREIHLKGMAVNKLLGVEASAGMEIIS